MQKSVARLGRRAKHRHASAGPPVPVGQPSPRPRPRVRWPLRGGRRLRYNQSPFFAVSTERDRQLPFDTTREAMHFARMQMYRSGWDAILRMLEGFK
jgi:hypothetical protein